MTASKTFIHVIQAGGVEELVTPAKDWDLDRALAREKVKAFVKFGRELEQAGYITSTPMARTGDYHRVLLTLTIPYGGIDYRAKCNRLRTDGPTPCLCCAGACVG